MSIEHLRSMQPILCMISEPVGPERFEALVARVGECARAGVHLVQIRQHALDGGPLLALVRECVAALAGTRTRLLVNERLDVALAGGAHGVHLRADSMPASRVRAMAPRGFLIGRSVHDRSEALAAELDGGVDYLVFGTRHPTDFGWLPRSGAVRLGWPWLALIGTVLLVATVLRILNHRTKALSAEGR